MFRLVAFLLVTLATSALSAPLPCERLKSEIEAKLRAKNVKNYVLNTVPSAEAPFQKGAVVGTCEGGTRKIMYVRTDASARDRQGAREEPELRSPQERRTRTGFIKPGVLTFDGAPPVRLGMKQDQVVATLGSRLERSTEGDCVLIQQADEQAGDANVWRFWFLNDQLVHIGAGTDAVTDLGVEPGDPISKVRNIYFPDYEISANKRPNEEELVVTVLKNGSSHVLTFRSDDAWKQVSEIAVGAVDVHHLCNIRRD